MVPSIYNKFLTINKLGYHEWQLAGQKLQTFWSSIFMAGANYQSLINKMDPALALFPLAEWEGQLGLQLQGQLTYNTNTIREMIEKNVTTFGHLCVQDTLGRTTLNLKTFKKLKMDILWIYYCQYSTETR